MPNYIAVYENEGGVAVVIPAEGGKHYVDMWPEYPYPSGPRRLETDLEQIERIAVKDVPQGANALIKTTRDLPVTRNFRGAWRLAMGVVNVDMPAAREIHRENIRRAREATLKQLDTDYMRADEQNDVQAKASIAQQKQALRDLPQAPAIMAAETPEQLEATWPTAQLGASPYQ